MNKYLEQWIFTHTSIKALTALALAVLFGCATQLPSPPPDIQSSSSYERSGEETARKLTTAYHNTAANCGTPTTPAFLCSGVTLRITKTSNNYDPWDHSDFSRKTDAVSFSYLRADTKFVRTPWYGVNGLIFYPYLNAPAGKNKTRSYLLLSTRRRYVLSRCRGAVWMQRQYRASASIC
jgi:hypothetical protein